MKLDEFRILISDGESFVELEDNDLYREVSKVMESPFFQSILRLNQYSRTLGGHESYPTVLVLSNDEGGYAKKGLNIKDEKGIVEYPELNYVDLVLDLERMKNGDFYIFPHELAHVYMENLIPNYPEYKSPKQHVSMGITDYLTAFYEGWAIQYERHTYNHMEDNRNIINESKDVYASLQDLWHCSLDSKLRLDGVRDNLYLRRTNTPKVNLDELSISEKITLEHTSHEFDAVKLKNPQELMSCEGFVATLFYRLLTDETIRNNYLDLSFYRAFNENISMADISPFENVNMKCFYLFKLMNETIDRDDCPTMDFINLWCETFENDKDSVMDLFFLTTAGVTADDEMPRLYEKVTMYGLMGNPTLMSQYWKQFKEKLKEHKALDQRLGKEVWTDVKDVSVLTCLWGTEVKPHRINVNTATFFELKAAFLTSDEKVNQLIERRSNELFESIEEVLHYIKE